MTLVGLPAWAGERVLPIAEACGLSPADLLYQALREAPPERVQAAATDLMRELSQHWDLLLTRRKLEAEQRELLARLGKPGPAETDTALPSEWQLEWPDDVPPSISDLTRVAILATVFGQDEIPAAMALNSWRAAVHYACYELAYDNQVIGFHNASMRARAGEDRR